MQREHVGLCYAEPTIRAQAGSKMLRPVYQGAIHIRGDQPEIRLPVDHIGAKPDVLSDGQVEYGPGRLHFTLSEVLRRLFVAIAKLQEDLTLIEFLNARNRAMHVSKQLLDDWTNRFRRLRPSFQSLAQSPHLFSTPFCIQDGMPGQTRILQNLVAPL